jgi:hypothetical protein
MSLQQESDTWNERLKLLTACPVCKSDFDVIDTRIIETYPDAHLVHITCKKCRHALLAVVALTSEASQSVGLVTDLTYEDVLRFAQAEAIAINDVVAAHNYFEQSGWAKNFLKKKTKKRTKKQ